MDKRFGAFLMLTLCNSMMLALLRSDRLLARSPASQVIAKREVCVRARLP